HHRATRFSTPTRNDNFLHGKTPATVQRIPHFYSLTQRLAKMDTNCVNADNPSILHEQLYMVFFKLLASGQIMPLAEDRYFSPDPTQRKIARTLYEQVADLPLICPHGHVDPRLFADPDYRFGSPTELIII